MWQAIELREIQVFLTLCEELHFGRTADRLGLTQSRVSQSVRSLERKLGVQLADRTSRRVRLTVAGERFRDEVGAAHAGLMAALESQSVHRTSIQPMRLGIATAAAVGSRLRSIITAYEASAPGRSVQIVGLPFRDRFGPLRRGEVDVMVTGLPLNQPDLVTGPVIDRQPHLLAVAVNHPLAARADLRLEDLADYPIGQLDIDLPPELLAELAPRWTPTGRPIPRSDMRIQAASELMVALANGQIVQPVTTMFADSHQHPEVTYRPIRDLSLTQTVLAWRRRDRRPELLELLRLASTPSHSPAHASAQTPRTATYTKG